MTTRRDDSKDATDHRPRNLAASMNQRLLTLARQRGEGFQSVLTRYAIERLLSRIGQSISVNDFTVKGAVLFALWNGELPRATRDLDLLGSGSPE